MSDQATTIGASGVAPEFDAIVVGAGFAGLYATHKLLSLGFRVRAFEKGGDVGGVWYWNRYPGARCDCESYYYSYSFSEALQQDWDWSLRYSEQPEILDYLAHVADRFDLRPHITFNAPVEHAAFDETANLWRVRVAGGGEATCRFLITAAGCLSQVNWPDIAGLRTFEGEALHTAAWPHDSVDFTGKRVGIIGTGASAVQAIPRIARQAEHLTVFQRTANWVLPAHNRPAEPAFDAWVKANYGDIRQRCATSAGAVPFEPPTVAAMACTDAERRQVFEDRWATGGMSFFSAFTDLFSNPEANQAAQAFVAGKIREAVHDPKVAEALTPLDHPIGVKRPPVDDDYYDTFNRPNVTLVDLRRTPIAAVEAGAVRTSAADYPLDTLVLATGFDAITGALLAMDVRGRGGLRLSEAWAAGPRSYLGLSVAGFPNLFTVTGPLSPSVLANMPTAVEQHVDWIAQCLGHMREARLNTVEATDTAESAWVDHTAEIVAHTLYAGSSSWYSGANIPGKPRRFGVYLGGFSNYRQRCDAIAEAGYEGFRFAAPANG